MNKKLKKFMVYVLSVGMLLGTLAGCGNKAPAAVDDADSSISVDSPEDTPEDTPEDSSTPKGDVVEITYAIWDKNQEPGMQAIADEFMRQNPDIKVKVEVTPWGQYWTKLEAAATGGALPDVFWMHINNFLKYEDGGMLMDLTERINDSSAVDLNNFPEGLVNLYSKDDKNYAIPKDYDTIGLWYNKTLFDEAGIPYPDDTWDWDKLVEVAKELTDEEKGIYGFGAQIGDMQAGYWNSVYQNGGYIISDDNSTAGFDSAETQEAIQWWVDLGAKHGVSPTIQQFADTSATEYFTSGKMAMAFHGSWMVSSFKDNEYAAENCDVAVLPKGKQRATIYNGLGNAASTTTKYPEESWRFIEFMGTEEANILQAEYGSAIPAFKGCEQPWIDSSDEFNLAAYPEMLDDGIIYMNTETSQKWEELEKTMMARIFSGQISVEDGCNELAEEVNALLDTEK